jgi:hypothetical protein
VTTTDLYGIEGQVLTGSFASIGPSGRVWSRRLSGLHIGLDEPVAIKCLQLRRCPVLGGDSIVRRFGREQDSLPPVAGLTYIARTIAAGTTMAPATGALVPYMVLRVARGFHLAEELCATDAR